MRNIHSMTGFANAQTSFNDWQMGIELRSVNSRFLDLTFRLPDEWRHLESQMRLQLTKTIQRGKVECRLQCNHLHTHAQTAPKLEVLLELKKTQAQVLHALPNAVPLSVADVLRLTQDNRNIQTYSQSNEEISATVLQLLQRTVVDFLGAREVEGNRLASMLLGHVHQLRALATQAAPLVPQLVSQQQQKFLTRWSEALRLVQGETQMQPQSDINSNSSMASTTLAQERALNEVTTFAIRIDIAEELMRLGSHLDEIEKLLLQGGQLGKRLDFLIQELHREANTLGSKSVVLDLSRISVDMKVLIEQMREQVQNIE